MYKKPRWWRSAPRRWRTSRRAEGGEQRATEDGPDHLADVPLEPVEAESPGQEAFGTSWWMVDQYAGEEKVPTVPSQTANTIRAKGDRAPPKARRARATMPRR